jgi:hypothetical protein
MKAEIVSRLGQTDVLLLSIIAGRRSAMRAIPPGPIRCGDRVQ